MPPNTSLPGIDDEETAEALRREALLRVPFFDRMVAISFVIVLCGVAVAGANIAFGVSTWISGIASSWAMFRIYHVLQRRMLVSELPFVLAEHDRCRQCGCALEGAEHCPECNADARQESAR